MKKEEATLLTTKKIKQGKSKKQINKELSNVYNFCRELKDTQKLIIKRDNQIAKLERENKRLKKKVFNFEFKKLQGKK